MNNNFYQSIIQQAPFGYAYFQIITDNQGNPYDYRIIEVNKAFETQTGFMAKEIIGKTIREITPFEISEDVNAAMASIGKIAPTGNNLTLEQYSKSLGKWFKVNVFSPTTGFFSTLIEDITAQKHFEEETLKSQKRAMMQRSAIAGLLEEQSLINLNLNEALKRVTQSLSKTLEVARASVWTLSEDKSELTCLSLFDGENQAETTRLKLQATIFPSYFEAIKTESRIYAEDAQNDPRTIELIEYLKSNGITSMLDAGILIEGQLLGVVCCEHIGPKRKWNTDEEAFVSTAAALVAQLFAESERRQAEKFANDIIHKNPISFQILDKDGFTLHYNEAHTRLFGAVPPPGYSVFNDPALLDSGFGDLLKRAKSGEIVYFPDYYYNVHDLNPDFPDKPVFVRVFVFPIFNDDGKPERFVLMHEDISERKHTEHKLWESEQKYKQIFDNTNDIIFILEVTENQKFRIITFNSAEEKVFGSVKNFIGKYLDEFLPEDIYAGILTNYHKCIQTEEICIYDEEIFWNGQTNTFNTQLIPLKNAQGRVYRIIGISRDITDTKNLTKQLISTNETLKQLNSEISEAKKRAEETSENLKITLNSIGDAVISTDTNGNIVSMNPIAEHLTGWSDEAARGKSLELVFNIFNAQTRQKCENPVCKVIETGKIQGLANHTVLKAKNGKEYQIADSAAPIKNLKGEIVGVVLVFRDVTQEYESAKTLAANEKRYRTIFSRSPFGIVQFDETGHIVDVNPEFVSIIGSSKEDLIGLDMFKTLKDKILLDAIRAALNGKTAVFENIYKSVTANKSTFVKGQFVSIADGDGIVTGGIGIFEDISEKKKAEAQINTAKQTYYDILNSVSEAIYIEDPQSGKFIDVNKGAERIYGCSRDEIIGQTPETIAAPGLNNIKELEFTSKEVFRTGIPARFDFWALRKNGEIFPKEVILNKGRYFGKDVLIATARDVSEKKMAEKAIRHEQILLRTLIDNLPDTIYIKDAEGRKIVANRADLNVIGAAHEADILGKTDLEVFNNEIGSRGFADDMHIIATGEPVINREEYFNDKNGALIWLSTSKIPLYDDYGKIVGLVGIGHNITERKVAEKELIIAKENAEKSDKLKTAFMNNISHEIRTPLNVIMGFGGLMSQSEHSVSKRSEYYNDLQKSSDRLIQTVTDYMDISKIVTGNMEVNSKTFGVYACMDELSVKTRDLCAGKNIEVCLQLSEDIKNLQVTSDSELLQKVMLHLLANAAKFTVEGTITFGCSATDHQIQFFVRDTGQGIASDKLQQIFDVFMQENTSMTRGHEGSGLGLAIARGIVSLLGGKIWVESERKKGSTFYFTIPVNKTIVDEKQKSLKTGFNGNQKPVVLVAEDDDSNFLYLQMILKKAGITIIRAENGVQAVEICNEHPELNMVLMDIKMPVMGGLEAMAIIKKQRHSLPIIALTAFAQTGDETRFREAGFDDYLSKPLKKELLLTRLENFGIINQ